MQVCRLVISAFLVLGATAGVRADSDEAARVALIRRVSNSVARINVIWTSVVERDGKKTTMLHTSGGTGFVIMENNKVYLVTNNHVVATPANAKPRMVAGFNAGLPVEELTLVGTDSLTDIAVLQAKHFTPESWKSLALSFAQPDRLEVGQTVLAIGYPHSQTGGPSVSHGIISALDRVFSGASDLIQTDAGINHGNSGGPLINMRGEVVGVNTYKYVADEEIVAIPVPQITVDGKTIKVGAPKVYQAMKDVTMGINYARSCRSALAIVRQLIKNGKIERPDLGFTYSTLSWNDATVLSLPEGVLITSVRADGPAASAKVSAPDQLPLPINQRFGLTTGVLTEIRWDHPTSKGKAAVKSHGDMQIALAQIPMGSTITLKVIKASPQRIAIIIKAMSKGWVGMADELTPEMVADWLRLGAENMFDKTLEVEYTLAPRKN